MTGHQWLDVLIGGTVAFLLALLLLIAARAIRRHRGKLLQLEAAYRQFSSQGALTHRNGTRRLTLPLLAVLVLLSVVLLGLLLSRAAGERAAVESNSTQSATPGGLASSPGPPSASDPTSTSTSTTTPGAGANAGSGSADGETIQLEAGAGSARPFQPVQIRGRYPGGADTFLRVERWEAGKWLAFPIPTKTDQSGHFTAHVEFGQPGRYRLRVLDPNTGMKSKTFVLVIKD